ncbi:nuclear envelope pore membrane protein POM 121-like [Festucalex cinctus]
MGNYFGKLTSWWSSLFKTQGPKKLSIQTDPAVSIPDRKLPLRSMVYRRYDLPDSSRSILSIWRETRKQRLDDADTSLTAEPRSQRRGPSGTKGHVTSTPPPHDSLQQPSTSWMGGVLPPARWPNCGKKEVIRTCPKQKSVTVKIARPDHNSSREPSGTDRHFTITPQRHYPLQQLGTSSTGVVLPVRLGGFNKKPIFTPRNIRNCIRIPRPDHISARMVYQKYAAMPKALEDHCSRKRAFKKSRKQEVDDADASVTAEQRSKRRPIESEESSHSANSAPISSTSGARVNRGTNAIASSYSSSRGLKQFQLYTPTRSLPSPAPSRSQTAEKTTEITVPLERPTSDKGPSTTSINFTNSSSNSGVQKRKIQLVPLRNVPISLPPVLELGYTITAKDLDEEKAARFRKIQELLGFRPGLHKRRIQLVSEALPRKLIVIEPSWYWHLYKTMDEV